MVAALRLRATDTYRDDDVVPLMLSWLVAVAAGAAWLLAVYLTPMPNVQPVPAAVPAAPTIGYSDIGPRFIQPGTARTPGADRGGATHVHASSSPLDIAEIFAGAATGSVIAHISQFIPGATPVHGDVAPRGESGKTTLSASGVESTPGMAQLKGNGGASGSPVGSVMKGGAIGRSEVHVRPLAVSALPLADMHAADATALGAFVRAHVAQLETCYERSRGTDLAGVVSLRLTIGTGGAVRTAEIVRRTWSGPAAAETEGCLLDMVKGWHVPSGADGSTFTLPISFTRGG